MDEQRRATRYHREGWDIEEFKDRNMDGRKGKKSGQIDGWGYTCTGMIRSKRPFSLAFCLLLKLQEQSAE